MKQLQGKTALVTGGFGGLGKHFAGTLAGAGATVVVTGRRLEQGEAFARDSARNGWQIEAVPMDVTNDSSVRQAFEVVGERHGAVDILVNNAGVAATAKALDTDDESWDKVVQTNLTGVWRVARHCARQMVARGQGGAIVNIASILGLRVAQQVPAYASSKAAVIQLTHALALEWARHGIRVNAIAPGYFATDLNDAFVQTEAGAALVKRIPQRRLGEPRELDGALLLLASDAGSYMTGSVIAVDGGHLVSTL
jgi:NAD(P)-dependent dehydrogenase (short-subunit alcohol dehydrogenase family)